MAGPGSRAVSTAKTAIVSTLLLAIAAGGVALVFATEPTAAREGATKTTAMLVRVVEAERGTFRPVVTATGVVEAADSVELAPEVGGRVAARAGGFEPGAFVDRGDVLVRVDPADYRQAVAEASAALAEARASLEIERGRQDVARREAALLDAPLSTEERARVLREPQRAAAEARVQAAEAALDRARRDLRRTRVVAPFDAHVIRRDVSVGATVAAGDPVGRLAATRRAWVATSLPLRDLPWVEGRDGPDGAGARARVRLRSGWPEGASREGRVAEIVRALSAETRFARVLVEIPDPFARAPDTADPPLVLGAFVEVAIEGRPLEDVVRIDRDHLRARDTVWVMADGTLDVRDVEVAYTDARHAYVRQGLEGGERVVASNLATVVDGAALRVVGEGAGER